MNNTLLDTVAACSKDLMKFGFSVEEFATLVQENNMTDAEVLAVAKVFEHLFISLFVLSSVKCVFKF